MKLLDNSLKAHEDNKNTNLISSGRPGSLVTLLTKTIEDYFIEAIRKLMQKNISVDINDA